jgi:tRNA pseudouridine synthase 10
VRIKKFGARQAKITWIGSEDEFSLVLGSGRPFFSKLVNPHKRNTPLSKKIDLDGVSIQNLHPISKIPSDPVRFRTEVMLEIETESKLEPDTLKALQKLKEQPIILYENSGHKNKKRIYSIKFKRKSDKLFKILMESDGGIPIKRFVTGQEIEPNLSSILKTNCKCKLFDFHKIIVTK